MKKISLGISITTVAIVLSISGCGNNNGSMQSTDTALNKGVFTDSPVKNLFYQTSSGVKGYTNQNGTFNYKTGDYVTFKLGNLTLGETKASSVVTPSSLFVNLDTLKTIPFVLQSLDTDGNISNGIQLPSPEILNKVSFNDINLSNPTDTVNAITTIKSELKNKNGNYTFPNMNLESSLINYKIFENLNYYSFMKKTKKSFLVLPNGANYNILELENKKIYSNNKLIGSYEFNQSLLTKSANTFYTADNLPSNNLVIDNSSDSSNSVSPYYILDLNISGNILKISQLVINIGDIWVLGYEDAGIIQTNDIKSAIFLNLINNSFKTNTNEEFYIAKITANGEENGTIKFEKDGNVTIAFGKKTINAFVSDDGNVYSKDNNSDVILDTSSILFDLYHDTLFDNNYIISPEKENINKVESLFKNDPQTYMRDILGIDFSGGDSSSLM